MDIREEDRVRLMDIADAIREIQSCVEGLNSYEKFEKRYDAREAVTSQLAQIGSAASLLSDEFKETYGNIDWNVLAGLHYASFDDNLELDMRPMWHVIEYDLPEIKDEVLDLATLLENEADLEDVSLNQEDLNDLKEMQASVTELKETSFNDVEDIHLMDESEVAERADEDFDRIDTSFIDKRFTNTVDLIEKSSLDDDIAEES